MESPSSLSPLNDHGPSAPTQMALLVGGLFISIVGQAFVEECLMAGLLFYGVGLALWIAGLRRVQFPLAKHTPDFPEGKPIGLVSAYVRLLVGLLTVALALLTFGLAQDGQFSLGLLIVWLGAIGCGWFVLSVPRQATAAEKKGRFYPADALSLALVLCLGAAVLFYDLDRLPRDMISDHVENVQDVQRIQDGETDIYFGDNSGREPLYFYLTVLVARVYDTHDFTHLKMAGAIAGLLTLPLLYALGRQVEDRLTGTLAAGLAAVSTWHLIMSRLGFRVILGSLASAALLITLWQALHSGRRRDFLLTGLVLGAGMYGYASFRIAPLLVLAILGLQGLRCSSEKCGRRIKDGLALFLMALLVYLPLLSFWLNNPDLYWLRADTLGSGNQTWEAYLGGLAQSLLMFNFHTDPVDLNIAAPGMPVLGVLTGPLFLLGLVTWLWRLAHRRRMQELLIPLALIVFILPSALAVAQPLEMPSSRRAISALPVVMLLAGSGLALPLRMLFRSHQTPQLRWMALGIGVGALALSAAINLNAYFDDYREQPHQRSRSERYLAHLMQQEMLNGVELEDILLVYDTGWLDPRGLAIWLEQPAWNNVVFEISQVDCLAKEVGQPPRLILLQGGDSANLADLQTCFPQHKIGRYRLPNGFIVVAFYII